MPFPALLLILATLLPLASCLTVATIGRRLVTPLAGYIAIICMTASFLCSGWAMLRWIGGGNFHGEPYGKLNAPIVVTWPSVTNPLSTLPHVGPAGIGISIYVDSLTLSMFLTITLTALLIHLFAIRSLRRDPRFGRFFLWSSLIGFATLAMILSGSLLQMILFMELVGFSACLLIGFRRDDPAARKASTTIFVVNRIADIGFVLGVGILFRYVSNPTFPGLWMTLENAAVAGAIHLPGGLLLPTRALTVAGVCLFIGAAGRCAQFPLHVWAGDVANGVAPAAATILGITLSLAGVYLLARLFPLFTPSARMMIAIIGLTTLAMGAFIATAQPDLKGVLAFIAISQLGLMILGIGVGSWIGALFHLVAYSFFQVLLFLAAGAVVRATRGETQLARFGALALRMPMTAIGSAVAALALCGVGSHGIGLSGYFSRTLILRHSAAFAALAVGAHRSRAYWAFLIIPVLAAMASSFAITRWWMLVFAGKTRDQRSFDRAREVSVLVWPLVALALISALAGRWLGIRDMLESSIVEARQAVESQAPPASHPRSAGAHTFEAIWPGGEPDDEEDIHLEPYEPFKATTTALTEGNQRVAIWIWPATAIGILAGLLIYLRGDAVAQRLVRNPPFSWFHLWLRHRMFFDELYESLFVVPVLGLMTSIAHLYRTVTKDKPLN